LPIDPENRVRLAFLPLALCLVLDGTTALAAEIPATPAAAEALLFARPFRLDRPFTYRHDSSGRKVDSGLLLVVRVDPELLRPRDGLEPLLMVGEDTAQQASRGFPSGVLVVLVPDRSDLAGAPVWFGSPELPERATPELIARELADARAAGIRPFASVDVDAALLAGGEVLRAPSLDELGIYCFELVRRFAPDEASRAPGAEGRKP
jgi:hypothetical protein